MWVVMLWARQHPWKKTLMQCQIYYGGWANKPIESHAGYTHAEKGSFCNRNEQSQCPVWSPAYWRRLQVERWAWVPSQEAALATLCLMEWKSGGASSITRGTAMVRALSSHSLNGHRCHSYQCLCRAPFQVSGLVVLGIPGPFQGHSHGTPLPLSWHSTWHNARG